MGWANFLRVTLQAHGTAQRRTCFFLREISLLFLLGFVGYSQSLPNLSPPPQNYIYDFYGSVSAPVPAVPALNLGASFSIEFWMMLDFDIVDSQYMRILYEGAPSGDPYSAYELDLAPGTHQLTYSQSTSNPGSFRSAQIPVSLVPGQWYHLAIVSNNLQVTLYLNAQQQATFTAAGPPPINSLPLVLSGQTFGDGTMICCGFPGSLRQFRIWGRALQPAEISSFATKTLSGTEAGLIADWPLDDGLGGALRDVGPNNLALTLANPTATEWYPAWLRTEILASGPYYQVERLAVPEPDSQLPTLAIPIDFDSDGNVDLLVCGNNVHTTTKWPCAAFRNDGKGNFSDVTTQVLGPNPPAFEAAGDYCVADFNGDGRADVFIQNSIDCCGFPGGQNALLLQTANGRLEDVTSTNLPAQMTNTQRVACGDIDGDGDIDIYLASFNATTGNFPPQLYLNDSTGHFTVGDPSRLPAILQAVPSQFGNASASFIDVNNDGHLDLFLGAVDSWDSSPHDLLLLNDGNGYFTLAPDNALPNRYGGRDWGTVTSRVADIDGDGWPDLINTVNAPNYAEGGVQILLNNHDGTFRDATNLLLQPAWPRYGSLYSQGVVYADPVYAADFNHDGFIDLLVQGVNQPTRLFLNTGPAGGGRLVEVTELLPRRADYFTVADFNGDGATDIAALIGPQLNNPHTIETWLSSRNFSIIPDLIPPVPTGPFFLRGNVLNSASFTADALAPGELITIFGSNLGPATPAVASPNAGSFGSNLSGTQVIFNGTPAPLIYASSGQVTAVVPFNLAPTQVSAAIVPEQSQTKVVVEYQGNQSPPVYIFVAPSAPGLFTADSSGAGPAAVLNVDSISGAVSLNTPQNPAPPGGILVAYVTGAGQTNPPSADGAVATSAGGHVLPVEAGLDFFPWSGMASTSCQAAAYCIPVDVLYAGPAPGIVAGVTQVNMRLPDGPIASGAHWLGISFGGMWSQLFATVSIR
jgi:uncharacterized protein (TIGR03437 family)